MDIEGMLAALWESGVLWKAGVAIAPFVWASVTRAQWAKAAKAGIILDCVEAATVAVYHQIVRQRKSETNEQGEKKISRNEASQFRATARNIAAGLAKERGIDLTAETRAEFLDVMIERTISQLKGGPKT